MQQTTNCVSCNLEYLMTAMATLPNQLDIRTFVVFDARVTDRTKLIQAMTPDVELLVLDPHQDGIQQITDFLFARFLAKGGWGDLALHIVAQAAPGVLFLGNSELSLDTMQSYAHQLSSWVCSSVSLYGEGLATGDAGEELLAKLHDLTGATIHALQARGTVQQSFWEVVMTIAEGQIIPHATIPFGAAQSCS